MDLANLTTEFGEARSANPLLDDHWAVAKDWEEISRSVLLEIDPRIDDERVLNDPSIRRILVGQAQKEGG